MEPPPAPRAEVGGAAALAVRAATAAACLALLLSRPPGARAASPAAEAAPPARARIELDLVESFERAEIRGTNVAKASRDQRALHVPLPGIFLHPRGAETAEALWREVAVPRLEPGGAVALWFRVGLRDGVPWEGKDGRRPNGVRFSVAVEGTEAWAEAVAGPGWRARALDLSRWAGRRVSIGLRTEGIEGDTNWDWALFGRPAVVSISGAAGFEPPVDAGRGLALARLECERAARVAISLGDAREERELSAGSTLVPLAFTHGGAPRLEILAGSARIASVVAGLWPPRVELTEVVLSSDLLAAPARPALIARVKNNGLGDARPGPSLAATVAFTADRDRAAGEGASAPPRQLTGTLRFPPLAPGAEAVARWELPELGGSGRGVVEVSAERVEFRITAPERELPPRFLIPPDGLARIALRSAGNDAWWADLETRRDSGWHRLGTIWPLARLILRDDEGARRDLPFTVLDTKVLADDTGPGSLCLAEITGAFRLGELSWPARLEIRPDASGRRFRLDTRLDVPRDTDLLAFRGPTILAGDRAFGARKEFAAFGGLEYLEGDEESSSTRDLAWPLSDRRVPAIHEIASPVMAVQGDGGLIAMVWDPRQEWRSGERFPAAYFLAPRPGEGPDHLELSLFAPSVGEHLPKNHTEAVRPLRLGRGETLRLRSWLVIDDARAYGPESIARGPHRGGLLLMAWRHAFDIFGLPEPSPPPRTWLEERALCRDAYHHAVWSEDPPGWRHCAGWPPGPLVGHALPLLLDLEAGVPEAVRRESRRRIDAVVARSIAERGPGSLSSGAGCHIVSGELPYRVGFVGESLRALRAAGRAQLAVRRDGLWRWYPAGAKHASLGPAGGHTLGQAARPSWVALRAARLSGDRELAREALEAMRQMERYEVPRGAQMWECPLLQPDILAAAYAIRAYCEAYRLTGDPRHLDHARYWAWSGMPFLYLWDRDGYPTMRYNVISVIGSTFHTHSWIGLPVVWCGLVYAYALQDLAELDDSLLWKRVARGILRSAQWQQRTAGASRGCYPDSWDMIANRPRPADINPENLLMNGFRLHGRSPEVRCRRLEARAGRAFLSSAANIGAVEGSPREGKVGFTLRSSGSRELFTSLARVPEPREVRGAGKRVASSAALQRREEGWLWERDIETVVIKSRFDREGVAVEIEW